MIRALLLSAATLGFASPALAYCPAFPDGPDSHNVQNTTQLALCQQGELGLQSEQLRQESQMRATLQQLQQQQQQLEQRLQPLLPQAAF